MEAESAPVDTKPTEDPDARRLYRLLVGLPEMFDRLHEAAGKFSLPEDSGAVMQAAERSREELAESVDCMRDLVEQVERNEDAEFADIEAWENTHARLLDNIGRLAQHSLRAYYGLLLEHACLLGAYRCEEETSETPFYPGHPDFPELAEFLKQLFGNPLLELEHCRLENLVGECMDENNRLDIDQLRDRFKQSFEKDSG